MSDKEPRAKTPTMSLARSIYAIANNGFGDRGSVPERSDAFDRMVAVHDAQIRRAALDEAFEIALSTGDYAGEQGAKMRRAIALAIRR